MIPALLAVVFLLYFTLHLYHITHLNPLYHLTTDIFTMATALPTTGNTTTEDRALTLLGMGIPGENVASALGVTAGRISQLLANKKFADQVATLRYENLQQHNVRDASYDSLEDRLVQKLEAQLPLLLRPLDTIRALQAINGAKRRGQAAPDTSASHQAVVPLVLPNVIVQKFTTNVVNQVVKAGEQELVTMAAGSLLTMTEEKEAALELAGQTQTGEL